MENKEAIELLEKAHEKLQHSHTINNDDFCAVIVPLDQAIALLKPCPDCAEKPESQEPGKPWDVETLDKIKLNIEQLEPEIKGMAESEYMSAEMREKFEAKNIPEKVETSSKQ